MRKVLEFLNKYLFLFLILVYLLNKYINTDLALQQTVLQILVVIMVLNVGLKFYFLKEKDSQKGTKTVKMGVIVLITAFVFLIAYAYMQGLIF